MKAVHFGAGNIGRGFIGEILNANGFEITFIDVNDTIIEELKKRRSYRIELADESHYQIEIKNVTGLNNHLEPENVIAAIAESDLVTTAIGPNILPHIAQLIAQGIALRKLKGVKTSMDVIACENMIGGSTFLKKEVLKFVEDHEYLETYIGFPDAAVDRIVPQQEHDDPLFVQVEPFSEWVVETTACRSDLRLAGVIYVDNLEPFIERKLFSVNTGHATVAYTGSLQGYETIDQAMEDKLVLVQLRAVLEETGKLLIKKWQFDPQQHEEYIEKIIKRFQNKYISDAINRVARTPLRKLGEEERFIRPVIELVKLNEKPYHLLETVGMIFNYYDPQDEQSCELRQMLADHELETLIESVTGIKNGEVIKDIQDKVRKYSYIAA